MTSKVAFSWGGGVDLSVNLSCAKLEVLALVLREFSSSEKRPENASGRDCRDSCPWGVAGFGTFGALSAQESVILLQTKDTLLMYRTPVTITNGTQSDRCLVLISQAGKALPIPVLISSSFSCLGFGSFVFFYVLIISSAIRSFFFF